MSNHEINQSYEIPQSFYEIIKPYVEGDDRLVVGTVPELLIVWQASIAAHEAYPQHAETIAEWTMSAAASSPLITQAIFEDVHHRFGQAEVSTDNNDEQWSVIKHLVDQLAEEDVEKNTAGS